jgi:RimJ/RimL family protein N-acetyltransferase
MLIGASVSLVPLSLAHVDNFSRYAGDASLWTWWLREPPIDSEGMRREVELALAQQRDEQRVPFSIFHHARREHIGSTSLFHIDRVNLSLEIGATWLATPFHRSGVNRECKELLFAYAFEVLKMNRVVLQTDELNVRSRRAIEKTGAKFEGIARENKVVWDGRIRSSAVYSLLRSEWKPTQGAV